MQTCSTLSSAWSVWSQWTSCSQTCGAGSRSRGRECENATADQNDSCQGEKSQAESCQETICPSISSNALCMHGMREKEFILTFFFPVDGTWLNWGEWSSCGVSWVQDIFKFATQLISLLLYSSSSREMCTQVSCGSGTRRRGRVCTGAAHGGLPCSGEDNQREICTQPPCPGFKKVKILENLFPLRMGRLAAVEWL